MYPSNEWAKRPNSHKQNELKNGCKSVSFSNYIRRGSIDQQADCITDEEMSNLISFIQQLWSLLPIAL